MWELGTPGLSLGPSVWTYSWGGVGNKVLAIIMLGAMLRNLTTSWQQAL